MAAVLSAALVAVSCNALWGIDELQPGTITSQAGYGGRGGDGGHGNDGGGGSGGSDGSGNAAACKSCILMGSGACDTETTACNENAQCAELSSCMLSCAVDNPSCHSKCIAERPQAVELFYAMLECLACRPDTCLSVCSQTCAGCAQPTDTCAQCVNGPCAQAECATEIMSCNATPACESFRSCVTACAGDQTCSEQCKVDHPGGVEPYNQVIRCLICTKPTCWNACKADDPSCAGW